MTFAEKLGRKIAKARNKAKLTKADAAREAGIPDWRQWHLYETGKKVPSAERFIAMAKALGVSTEALIP
jgi:transcriptional regulator with XRE-family HTH domain